MKSGALGFIRCRSLLPIFAIFSLIISGRVLAQQPASQEQSAPQAPLPAAQPISQAAASASGAVANAPKQEEANKETSDWATMLKLGVGDLLEVAVYNVPELSTKVRVSNAGDIYLPLIDYVHVEGLTQEEAQSLIAKRLEDGGFVRSPHVTIFIDEANSQGVTILGEVGKPGIYPEVGDHHLYSIISQAGGFTQTAARKVSILRRNQPQAIHVDLPRNLADDVSANIEIQPGDTLTVPRAPIIYVVGDVGRPSGLLVDNGSLTVLQALALAGGTNKTAKLGGAKLLRKGPNGMTETKIEIKKMLEAKIPDMPLQGDDILFVPVSGGKVLASRTFETAMAAATAVTVYSVHP
ncbi:MAG TPA: polysaccharide biosynthesis/export family protein [Candidatus Eisenbacteria bacterium]|nr:polysaccharide biosynthesis/export family protein [Candidatus Eisenbacteria bacterium]